MGLSRVHLLLRSLTLAILLLLVGGCDFGVGLKDSLELGLDQHGTGLAVCSRDSESLVSVEIARGDEPIWSAVSNGATGVSLDNPVPLVDLRGRPEYDVSGEMPQLAIGDQVTIRSDTNYTSFQIDGVIEFELARDLDCSR